MQQTDSAARGSNPGGTPQEPTSASVASQAAARHQRERESILKSFGEELDNLVLFVRHDGEGPVRAEYLVTQFVRALLGVPGEGSWVDGDEMRLRFRRQQTERTAHQRVSDMLLEDGIRPHLSGYPLLRGAVLAVAADRAALRDMMGIYASLAQQDGTTASRAERAMRHALEDTEWHGHRPTISEYVALLAERLTTGGL